MQIFATKEDIETLKSNKHLWQPIEAKDELIEYIERENFTKGSLIVKTEKGIVDARLEERISKIKDKFIELWEYTKGKE